MAEQTLTGYLFDKAKQSRKEAKAEKARQDKAVKSGKKIPDKDRKGLFRKAFSKNLLSGLFGGKKASGGKKSGGGSTSSGSSSSAVGGSKPFNSKAKGLEKILIQGFGSLAADTTAISGGLATLTNIMNSQLNTEGEMSSSLQGINSILADQLETQVALIEAIGGQAPRGGGGGESSLFGTSGSRATKDDTFTSAAMNIGDAIKDFFGRSLDNLKTLNPFKGKPPSTPGGPSGPKGYYDDATQISRRNASNIAPDKPKGFMGMLNDIGTGIRGKTDEAISFGKGFIDKGASILDKGKNIAGNVVNSAKGVGDNILKTGASLLDNPITKRLGLATAKFGGRMLPVAGTAFSASDASDRAKKGDAVGAWLAGLGGGAGAVATGTSVAAATGVGAAVPAAAEATSMVADIGLLGWDILNAFNPNNKLSAGGTTAMIGEAGKEAVVPLHSADSPAKSKAGMDPAMQASAGSMLAVTDQFIKSMGPLGGAVSQALGPDISNLAKTFGMSQALPNLNIGGGKFKEDAGAKKTRESFVKDLIAGSLESLGAKKKSQGTAPSAPPAPPPTGETGTPEQKQQAQERAMQTMAALPGGVTSKPMMSDGKEVQVLQSKEKIKGEKIGTTVADRLGYDQNVIGPSNKYRPVEGTNQERWYDSDGRLYSWKPNTNIRELTEQEARAGWNGKPFARSTKTGHVRVNPDDWTLGGSYQRPPAEGEYSYKFGQVWRKQSDGKFDWEDEKLPGPFGGVLPLTPATDIRLERGGEVVQRPWWDFIGRFIDTHRNTNQSDYSMQNGLGAYAARARTGGIPPELLKEMRGYESGGTVAARSTMPAVSPARYTPTATAETEATNIGAIVNIIGSGGQQSPPMPVENEMKAPSTANYVRTPMPGGLASSILTTQYWG